VFGCHTFPTARDGALAEIEHEFPKIGRRKILFHARRLHQASQRTQLMIVLMEDVTGK
jgi:hypothetical protein